MCEKETVWGWRGERWRNDRTDFKWMNFEQLILTFSKPEENKNERNFFTEFLFELKVNWEADFLITEY